MPTEGLESVDGGGFVLADVNGPDCDCTVYDGTAEPVTVPESARLSE